MADLFVDYSLSRNNNFISMRLFYQHLDDGIFDYSIVNDEGILETNVNNLGAFHQYGLQFKGTLKLEKQIDINAYARYQYYSGVVLPGLQKIG